MTVQALAAHLIYASPAVIALLIARGGRIGGTDQYFHRAIIEAIRANRHRFIERLNFVHPLDLAYPQLLHWVLSFVKPARIDAFGRYLAVVFHFLSGAALLGFVHALAAAVPGLGDTTSLLWWTGVVFALTPYHYDVRNAKNVSISARGLGLFLGQAFVYAVVLYRLTESFWYLAAVVVLSLLMLVSSQFAIQFLLFATPVLALYYRDVRLLAAAAAGVLLFPLLMPGVARRFFRGQLGHKKLYAKYAAERFILAYRPSIWRDFVYDFWIGRPGGGLRARLGYLLSNSVVLVVTSMPFVVPALWVVVQRGTSDEVVRLLAGPLLASLAVFVGTSFRRTRFLGEPERYVEFSLGIVALLVARSFAETIILPILLAWSIAWIGAQLVLYRRVGKDRQDDFYRKLEPLRERLLELARGGEEVRLLSNNTQAAKVFFSPELKLLWVSLQTEHTGSFHFTRVFPESYNYMAAEVVVPMAIEFSVNYIVLDTRYAPRFDEEAAASGLRVTPLETAGDYRLLRVG